MFPDESHVNTLSKRFVLSLACKMKDVYAPNPEIDAPMKAPQP